MKPSTRLCAILLCAALLLSCFPAASVRAAEPKTKDLGACTFDMTNGVAYYPTDEQAMQAFTGILLYAALNGGLRSVEGGGYDVNDDGVADFIQTTQYGSDCFQPLDTASLEGPVEIKLSEEIIQSYEDDDDVKAYYSSLIFVLPTKFDLWVAGVHVTTANQNNIDGKHVLLYRPEQNELVINSNPNGTFPAEKSYHNALVYSEMDGLTVIGSWAKTYTLTTEADYCFYSAAPNIAFCGNLRLKSEKYCVQAKNVQVTGFTLNVTGGERGIHAEQTLQMIDGTLSAHATNTANAYAVLAGKSIELAEHMQVQTPTDGEVKALSNVGEYAECASVVESGGLTPARDAVIYAEAYGLSVDGIYVTEANREDIRHNGIFSFDGDRTLSVKGDYSARFDNLIFNSAINDLVIRVEKDSVLHFDHAGNIGTYRNMTITGPGRLTLLDAASTALFAGSSATLTLEDLYLEVRGNTGIAGRESSTSEESLVIRNSCVLSKADYGSLCDFDGGITLEGCELIEPAGGSVGPASILDAEGNDANKVVIGPSGFRAYDLFVDNIWVTSENQDDILKNGVFSYADGTLRINGSHTASIDSSSWSYIIQSHIPDLTIYTAKDAELTAEYPIVLSGGGTITGPGHLTVNGKWGGVFVAKDQTLRIYRTALTAISTDGSGIEGPMDEICRLIIDGSDVTFAGAGSDINWAVSYCALELKDAVMISPEKGSFGDFHYTYGSYESDVMSVLDADGNPVKEAVFAANLPTYIVTFQPNGHGDAPNAQSVKAGKTATEPAAPAEEGWIFEGWYADKACTAPYDFSAPVTENISVYAKWKKVPSPTDGLPCSGGEDCPGRVFTDMPVKGNWAHDPIDWAIVLKITTGTSPTTFSPDAACTRAQAVSFLWRAAGSPEPTSDTNPFQDVREGTFYYKAVLWAVEKGITNGTSATTFSPDMTCTRGQIMTFVWRYEGEPTASTTYNPFTDVKPGAFYEQAVLWASETDVTRGIGESTFSPDSNCTRAQIVTFLYRALNMH